MRSLWVATLVLVQVLCIRSSANAATPRTLVAKVERVSDATPSQPSPTTKDGNSNLTQRL